MSITLLKGSDLVEYISERQAKQVRALIQSRGITPTLAILIANPKNLAIQKYVKFKQARAKQLGISIQIHAPKQDQLEGAILKLNQDSKVHGIILQLPLEEASQTEYFLNLITPQKDVDALGEEAVVQPATAGAILWLLAGYNIELKNKKILIIGQGRLVGTPITRLLTEQNLNLETLDISASEQKLKAEIQKADIIISATGSPELIKLSYLKDKQVVIDAGTAESGGVLLGDLDPEVYNGDLNLKLTPKVGGLGPLTISYLFENLIQLIDKSKV
jgi:methylenetetrahydrofolate dehydrogenase (NADP+)/methenyltetrahydrofolate cyclohydrolase